jgi:thiol-disulfide isomerase/thioredoxin
VKRIVVAVVVVVLVALFVRAFSDKPDSAAEISPGSPELFESTIDAYRGKPVVVNFWATWCGPCETEMPHIVAAAKRYEGRVEFLGVDVQDDPEAASEFAEQYDIPFKSLEDPQREIVRAQRLLGLPGTQFYDADGELAFVKQGEIKNDELLEKIEEVLRASR